MKWIYFTVGQYVKAWVKLDNGQLAGDLLFRKEDFEALRQTYGGAITFEPAAVAATKPSASKPANPMNASAHAQASLIEQIMAIRGRSMENPLLYRRGLEAMTVDALQTLMDTLMDALTRE